jgi:hypothetical protein
MYRILHYLYTYSTRFRSRYKYNNVIPISQSYLSHMYHGCVSPSIFNECYSINCALHHAVKSTIVLIMRVKCHWLNIIKNAFSVQHQSYQAFKKCFTACSDSWIYSYWSDRKDRKKHIALLMEVWCHTVWAITLDHPVERGKSLIWVLYMS